MSLLLSPDNPPKSALILLQLSVDLELHDNAVR